ncbi:MAG TPA: SUMF1/EgtB/PvdO family nonheme iron enzyme [Mycobacteriales bacterium]|nr:SUMF1/EgtB/PvdO family nonheme iron enzyme [Mycobacteriales bacterium]
MRQDRSPGPEPSRPVWIEVDCVSNERFATFVGATSHVTDAERSGFSFVFAGVLPGEQRPTLDAGDTGGGTELWWKVPGADWRHPDGPGSTVVHSLDRPVAHVSWRDAQAFCAWAGLRLPTEAEWLSVAGSGPHRWEWTADRFASADHRPSGDQVGGSAGAAGAAGRRCLRGNAHPRGAPCCPPGRGSIRIGAAADCSSGNISFRCLHECP